MNLHILCTRRGIAEETLALLKDEDWIGIDYGAVMLLNNGIQPIAAFGDFDSITSEERECLTEKMDVEFLPAEKDETDLEVGIKFALTLDYDYVYIHGATGGRLDHFLGNLQLLVHPDVVLSKSEFMLIDEHNVIQVLATGTHVIQQHHSMDYISFLPVNDHVFMTIEHLKYTMPRTQLQMGITRTISNEFNGQRAEVTVENGMAYMIQSKDK